MLNKTKNIKNNLIRKYNRRKAIRKLTRRYLYMQEVEIIMEDWITQRILGGQEGRRKELITQQNKVKEMKLFIDYLKQL